MFDGSNCKAARFLITRRLRRHALPRLDGVRHVRSKYKRWINRFRKIMQPDTKIGFVCDLECTDNSSLQKTLDFIAPGNDIMPSRQTVAAQITRFIRTIREAYPVLCFKMLAVQNDRLVELSIDN